MNQLKKRLTAMYIKGDISYLDFLLGSSNYIDMLANYDAVQQITEADGKMIDAIQKEKAEIQDAKKKIEENKKATEEKKAAKEEKQKELKKVQQEKDAAYSKLSEEEKKTQAEIDSYNAAISQINSQLASIARDAERKTSSSGGLAGLKFDGSFIWPCNNKIITSGMKRRWGRWHKGIDIGARYENVYAAASGYAYPMENPGGYGHYVMVIHGSGYITLYGHLSTQYVSYGQYVSQGQVIALSGNSGSSTGPHLHFEIRKASSLSSYFSAAFYNPLDYLPGGWTAQSGAFATS
jgi:murein DD-endopeptidase MepM/ murein hydrolase activator NlpD